MNLPDVLMFLALFGKKRDDRAPTATPHTPGPMPPAEATPPAAAPTMPAPAPTVAPAAAPSAAPAVAPSSAAPPIPWPAGPVPATLPVFPGPGWEPDTPVTPEIVQRAQYWNPLLWDFPSKTMRKPFVQENLGGQWVTFAAAWHPGDKGAHTYMATEAWRVKQAPVVAPSIVTPTQAPQSGRAQEVPAPTPAVPVVTPGTAPPGALPLSAIPHVMPYPGPGAWMSSAPYIKRYQTALRALGYDIGPTGADGKFGNFTKGAVEAFQYDHHLKQDGQAGPATATAIDAVLSAGSV